MKNTCLTSEEIITSFLNYLDNTIYSYAYMLDGSWGSGKTFFVKNMLIPAIEKREREKKIIDLTYKEKKILYVSLYGIKDTEEISRLLYIELRHVTAEELTPDIPDKLQSHKGRISSWLATTGKILADVVKDAKGIDLENVFNKVSSGFSLENCIFIFDDLERTSCNINDILGYINNFIEHDQIKVLLIANEAEINTVSQLDTNPEELMVCLHDKIDFSFLEEQNRNSLQTAKQDSTPKISVNQLMKRANTIFARNQAYRQIKEKVVGETVKYQPVYLDMIKELTEKHLHENEELKAIVIRRADKINEIAEHYDHRNLRTFLFFLSKMVNLYECLQEHTETLEKMTDYIFLTAVKYKTGRDLEGWDGRGSFEIRSIYNWLDFRNRCLAFRFVDEFILYGRFNTDEISEAVTLYETLEQKNAENENDPAKKLQNWMAMEEATLKTLLDEVLEKMRANEYAFEIYLSILHNFANAVSIGFDMFYLNQIMQYMKRNIEKATGRINLQITSTCFAGEEARALFDSKRKELCDVAEGKNSSQKREEIEDMLSDVIVWGDRVEDYIREHSNTGDNGFISIWDIDRVLTLIDESDSKNIEKFRYALDYFYRFSNIAEFYQGDYPNLKRLHDGLVPDKTQYDLIKRKNIEWLKDVIERKMELLKPQI